MQTKLTASGIALTAIGIAGNAIAEVFPMTDWVIPPIIARVIVFTCLAIIVVGLIMLIYALKHSTKIVKEQQMIIRELREPYLKDLPSLLLEIKRRLEMLVKNAQSTFVKYETLEEISNRIYKETGIPNSSIGGMKICLLSHIWAMNAWGIGLDNLVRDENEWKNLINDYDLATAYARSDKLLDNALANWWDWLKGIYSYVLFGEYLLKHDGKEKLDRYFGEGAKHAMFRQLDKAYSRVAKRIEELRTGDEAK